MRERKRLHMQDRFNSVGSSSSKEKGRMQKRKKKKKRGERISCPLPSLVTGNRTDEDGLSSFHCIQTYDLESIQFHFLIHKRYITILMYIKGRNLDQRKPMLFAMNFELQCVVTDIYTGFSKCKSYSQTLCSWFCSHYSDL